MTARLSMSRLWQDVTGCARLTSIGYVLFVKSTCLFECAGGMLETCFDLLIYLTFSIDT